MTEQAKGDKRERLHGFLRLLPPLCNVLLLQLRKCEGLSKEPLHIVHRGLEGQIVLKRILDSLLIV